MPITYVVERFDEFAARHGQTYIMSEGKRGREFLFADGAVGRQNPINYRWAFSEPSADDETRLELQKQFWTEKVQDAERDFRALKCSLTGWRTAGQYFNGRFNWDQRCVKEYGEGPSDGKAALLKIQAAVLQRRAELKKIEDAIYDLPQNVEQRRIDAEVEKQKMERYRIEGDRQAEIEEITI